MAPKVAVICVGNRLMQDDGIGPAAYDLFLETFEAPDEVELYDVGCMSMDMLPLVEHCDLILTVDALEGTGEAPGTVFEFSPDDMARHSGANASLHDLKLVDLFDAALLLGYECNGICLGMQAACVEPIEYVLELSPECQAKLPLLVETMAARLTQNGYPVTRRA